MIKLKNVTISYLKNDNILENISTIINENTTFLLGKNGSGKSTFLKFLSNTENLKFSGIYTVNNKKINDFKQDNLSSIISILMQETINTDIYVEDIYAISEQFSKNPVDKKIIEDIKSKFNISSLNKKNLNKLSGGEKQKILITAFLILNSKIVLFDEPFTGIDFASVPIFIDILKTFFKDKQKIISVHDLNYIYCNKSPILFLNDKKLTKFNNILEFVKSDTYKKNYPSVTYKIENEKIHFSF